jgi:hypothetical protein
VTLAGQTSHAGGPLSLELAATGKPPPGAGAALPTAWISAVDIEPDRP